MTQEDAILLREYKALGTLHETRVAFRQADILLEHIKTQPGPIKEVWVRYLAERKASL